MNYGTIEATFVYQDVQWVDPDFEDDGSLTVDVNDMEAIMDILHKKMIRAPVCSIKPDADSLVGEPVATSKEGLGGGGGGWHKALVVGSASLWRRLLASRP